MKRVLIVMLLAMLCALSAFAAQAERPAVVKINGACLHIANGYCYERYEVGEREMFGGYSFRAVTKEPVVFEEIMCAEAVKDERGFWFYHSKVVKGLRAVCSDPEITSRSVK